MDRVLGADGAAEQLDRAVGDHLVGVHVRLGAGTGLPDGEREIVVELAVDHLARRFGNGHRRVPVQLAEIAIGQRGRLLDDAERADQRQRHRLRADREIHQRAAGLRAPVAVGRHLDFAHRIGFGSHLVAHANLLCPDMGRVRMPANMPKTEHVSIRPQSVFV
jgi:hypothetical protein